MTTGIRHEGCLQARPHSQRYRLLVPSANRPPCPEIKDLPFLGAVSASEMAQLQRADPELLLIIQHLEGFDAHIPTAFIRNIASFSLRNSILYKRNFGNTRDALLVVPMAMHAEILYACHDEASAGHLGVSRIVARICEKYYWPKLLQTVQQYVKTCRECERRKTPPLKPAGLLQPIKPPTAPYQQVGMDLLGPFPTSTRGIVVATDYLTRYARQRLFCGGRRLKLRSSL